jgi:hypothetical protein
MAENIFERGDVLVFQYPDKSYGITVVEGITFYRGRHDYDFCRTTYKSENEPTVNDIGNMKFIGYEVPLGTGGFNKVVKTKCVGQRKLKKYAHNFKRIGNISLRENIYGGTGGAMDFEQFCLEFNEFEHENQRDNQQNDFTLNGMIEVPEVVKEFIKLKDSKPDCYHLREIPITEFIG